MKILIWTTKTSKKVFNAETVEEAAMQFLGADIKSIEVVDIKGGFYHIFTHSKVYDNDNIYLAQILKDETRYTDKEAGRHDR